MMNFCFLVVLIFSDSCFFLLVDFGHFGFLCDRITANSGLNRGRLIEELAKFSRIAPGPLKAIATLFLPKAKMSLDN
jgi:hypothetical protein